MNKLILTSLVSAGLVAAIPPAITQAPNTEGGPQAGQYAHRQAHERRAFRSPVDRAEARLAYLKTALKITEAQETQWNAFADVRRKQARETAQRRGAEGKRRPAHGRRAHGAPPGPPRGRAGPSRRDAGRDEAAVRGAVSRSAEDRR